MIVIQLWGGLGNQLFQYAAARHLAEINHTQLKLDVSTFDKYKLRSCRMEHFNISIKYVSKNELARLRRMDPLSRVINLFGERKAASTMATYKEPHFHYDPEMLSQRGSIFLNGYWQSEKYFQEIAPIIHRELTVKTPADPANAKLAVEIQGHDSVSLHIRRGDYVTNPSTNQFHGTCSLEYYREGMDRIATASGEPHFYVFSDDIPWAQENLKSFYPMTFVDLNGPEQDYEDLRLMTLCRHHIIANSSFSWWGAWLCENPNKMVIAPRRWFANPDMNAEDLIPEAWIRI